MFNKYFQEELTYLRELGREFAQAYPALAPMLADRGADPDVERLLEGVAFLTGRIRQKLDDEIPEVIVAIATLLFPHLVRPLPGATIVEITPLLSSLRERHELPIGSEFGSTTVDGVQCRYTSTSKCELVPWAIQDVRLESLPAGKQLLRIEFETAAGVNAAETAPEALRLHLAGELNDALRLLTWILEETEDVSVLESRPTGQQERAVSLGRDAIRAIGFDDEDALLPMGTSTFPGFRLLEEYYVLPQKFAFIEIREMKRMASLGAMQRFALCIRLKRRLLDAAPVSRDSIKLHCTPIVNIFETSAEPIRLTSTRERYLVRPSGLSIRHGEVYAIKNAQTIDRGTNRRLEVPCFYDFSHIGRAGAAPFFYTPHYSPSSVGDGVDVHVSFGTPEDGGLVPDAEVVSLDLLATNRTVGSLPRAGEIRVPTPGSPSVGTFRNLFAVTPHVSPPFGRELHWRVVAHAAMGVRSLTELAVLKSVLEVYNLHALTDRQAARVNELRIDALKAIRVMPAERLYRGAPVRGVQIDLDVEETGFAGEGDMYLFGAILDRFFSHYVSLNSFSRTALNGLNSKVRYAWPPRSGNLTML